MTNQDTPEQRLRRHREAVEWFFILQAEEQSTEQTERWIEWCSADPANQHTFERLLPLWQARWAVPEQHAAAPIAAFARVARRRWHLPRQHWALLATAAGLAVAVIGVLLVPRATGTLRLAAVAQLSSEIGQARSAQLVDGSSVALGGRSRIEVHFGAVRRDIEIEHGEALFKVRHDRTRPFVVHAGGLQVVAVGTVFDVDRRGSRVSVTVQEGVVEVSNAQSGATGTAPLRVARGTQVVFDQSGNEAPLRRAVSPEAADAWRRGHFEYVAEPLSAIIEDLNRYSSQQVVLQDSNLATLRYSGTIDVAALDEWLRALPNIFAVQVQFAPDHTVRLSGPSAKVTGN